jgi:hypothetical protein
MSRFIPLNIRPQYEDTALNKRKLRNEVTDMAIKMKDSANITKFNNAHKLMVPAQPIAQPVEVPVQTWVLNLKWAVTPECFWIQ